MAAKFTAGTNVESTRKITPAAKPKAGPGARNHAGLSRSNTMTGMPGYISAGGTRGVNQRAQGSTGSGPHREGDIGKRGGSGAKSLASAHSSPGFAVRNYKGSSTGASGTLKNSNGIGQGKRFTKNVSRGMRGDGPGTTARGKLPGGGKGSGIGNVREGSVRRAVPVRGARGTMESLAGRGARGKSRMY